MTAVSAKGLQKTFMTETSRTDIYSALLKFLRGRSPMRRMHALRDISFELKAGKSLALCGPNGSGKTTLLRILAGTLAPSGGTFSVQGRKACLLGFSSVMHDLLSVAENARFCSVFFDLPGRPGDTAEMLINESGLRDFRNVRAGELSSGMRIRLPFMAALHSRASVFLVDEALTVGDAAFQEKCLAKFRAVKAAGAAVVLATHSMELAATLADDILMLDAGRQVFNGKFTDRPLKS